MSRRFVIYPAERPDAPVRWRRGDGMAGEAARIADLAAHAPEDAETILVVPGEIAPSRAVRAPAGTGRQARAAAAFALEDEISEDLDGLHVGLGPALDGGERLVGLARSEPLSRWLAECAAAGLEVARLVPDHRALDDEEGSAKVLFDGERAIVRCDAAGFACESDLAIAVAAGLAEAAERPRLVLIGAPAGVEPDAVAGLEIVREPLAAGGSTLSYLAAGLDAADLDLRQGAFAPKTPWGRILKPWRPAAIAAAAAAAFWTAGAAADIVRYGAAAERNRDLAEARFTEAFPGAPRVGDIASQARRQAAVASGGSNSEFLAISAAFAAVTEALEGASLSSVRFSGAGPVPEASAEIVYREFEDIETIRALLTEAGFSMEEASTRQQGGAVVSTLIVRRR
ncbi:MAG: type II secretion system protein GspL [Pseudomonadota bacterium]